MSRREFIGAGVAGGALLALGARAAFAAGERFLHGVASGDPLADRVVLWTRVTPSADAAPGSGVGGPVDVRWEVASDPSFAALVASGTVSTDASRDHTVHVDVGGLAPGRDHWYRFHALEANSPVGRTRTAPLPGTPLDALRIGVVTCAEYEFGFFGAYRLLAERDDVDVVLHLGDYIYEFGRTYGPIASPGAGLGRNHEPPQECFTREHYRTRYGQYRTDPGLQALHAAHPVIAMYDDHEVANDTWHSGAENHNAGEGDFEARAAGARQAWREWLPVRQVDAADIEVVHRRFTFGDLVELWMLDERRYRDVQPPNALFSYGSVDPSINDPSRTILGSGQHGWLVEGLRSSGAAWKVLGNPVPFFPMKIGPDLPSSVKDLLAPALQPLPVTLPVLTVDDWNGYEFERQALVDVLADPAISDIVVLTGDYHESFAADLPHHPGDYALGGPTVGVEFVAPAVTSPGLGETLELSGAPVGDVINTTFEANLLAGNPWIRFHDGVANGFGVIELSPGGAHYDYLFVADRTDPSTAARVAASWRSERGADRLSPAEGPLPRRARSSGAPAPGPSPATSPPQPRPRPPAGDTLPATGSGTGLGTVAAAAIAAIAARRLARAGDRDR